jgi:hypothetical protein
MGVVSHELVGIVVFTLPVGLAALWLLYNISWRLVPLAPQGIRRVVWPVLREPVGSPLTVAISIAIGAATHLAWDSCTHEQGWLVLRVPLLYAPLASFAGHTVRLFHALCYATTFVGISALAIAYQQWRIGSVDSDTLPPSGTVLGNAMGFATITMAPVLMHHFVQRLAIDLALTASTGLLAAGFAWWIEPRSTSPIAPELPRQKLRD